MRDSHPIPIDSCAPPSCNGIQMPVHVYFGPPTSSSQMASQVWHLIGSSGFGGFMYSGYLSAQIPSCWVKKHTTVLHCRSVIYRMEIAAIHICNGVGNSVFPVLLGNKGIVFACYLRLHQHVQANHGCAVEADHFK